MKMKGDRKMFMAIDQYGITFHGLEHPRKDLMGLIGAKHASKIYADAESGKPRHVGYIMGKRWFRVYEVIPFKGGRDSVYGSIHGA